MKASVDPLTSPGSSPPAEAEPKTPQSSAPTPEQAPKGGAVADQSRQVEAQTSPSTKGAAIANAPEVTSKGGLTSDEAHRMGFSVGALQTLGFVVIVFGNQATTYTNRERRHLWSSRPSIWLLISSIADLLIASTLAVGGIAMTPLPAWMVAGTLAAAAAFAIILDFVKVPVFRRLSIT